MLSVFYLCWPISCAHGPCPAQFSSCFKEAFLGTPTAVVSHCVVFHTHHLSKKPKVSHSHNWLPPADPGEDNIFLALSHLAFAAATVLLAECVWVAWISPTLCIKSLQAWAWRLSALGREGAAKL